MTVGEKWAAFYVTAGLAGKPEVMVEELRRGFYSGAQAMMGNAIEHAAGARAEERVATLLEDLLEMLKADWQTYKERILDPIPASEHQVKGTLVAFTAGGIGMFACFMVAVEPDDEDENVARMEALQRELEDYLLTFKRRHGV